MKILRIIRIIYHCIAFIIFMIQAKESLYKYFQYPVVMQETETKVDTIQDAQVQICFRKSFDYGKESEYGYDSRSKFQAGMIRNSTRPTWMGIYDNITFNEIQNILYETDISKIKENQLSTFGYVLNKGFCKKASLDESIIITSTEKKLRVYLVHASTDTGVISDKSPNSLVEVGPTSESTFDYKVYELFYEVKDDTLHEGKKCVDYREKDENYRDCNYRVLKEHIYSSYGCYPPWMDADATEKCEINTLNKEIGSDLQEKTWSDIDALSDRRKIDVLKQCLPPCYQIHIKLIEKSSSKNWLNNAELRIIRASESVPVFKAAYSFDIFTLAVELGSALGLWLGKYYHYTTFGSYQCWGAGARAVKTFIRCWSR